VAKHRLAVRGVHMLAVEDRAGGVLQELPEQGPALDESEAAEVIVVDVKEVEGVQARRRAPRAAQESVEVGQAPGAVRDRLAV
jgi:hypothetical protein